MKQNTDTELDDLEHYLIGLDETGSNLTSDWVTDSSKDWSTSKKDVHKALQDLLHDAVILSKE
jgi:hypothetical protein